MKKAILVASGFFLLCSLSGCSGQSQEQTVKDLIDNVEATTLTLKKITNKETAEKYAPELARNGKDLHELLNKVGSMTAPDSEEKEQLKDKYEKKFRTAMAGLMNAWGKIKDKKEVVDALRDKNALSEFGYYIR